MPNGNCRGLRNRLPTEQHCIKAVQVVSKNGIQIAKTKDGSRTNEGSGTFFHYEGAIWKLLFFFSVIPEGRKTLAMKGRTPGTF
jgi:hypothetical protein